MASVKKSLIFIGTVFILVLSIVSFVFIPTFGGASSGPIVFGEWNGKPVEYIQDSFFARQIDSLSSAYTERGVQVDTNNLYFIMRQAYNSAIIRLAILDEMEKSGYIPSEKEINRKLIQYYYSDENGNYSPSLYNGTSETEKISRRAMISEEIIVEKYLTDYIKNAEGLFGMEISTGETDLIKDMLSPERSFYYTSFGISDYPDEEVEKFGRENEDLFAEMNLSMITLDSESEAARIHGMITSGETTFGEAVSTYSTKKRTDSDGKIINNMRKDINILFPDAADLETVISLEEGEISEPLRSGISYVIVRCDGAQEAADFSAQDTIGGVRDYMERNERGTIEDYLMTMARDFSVKAADEGFDETIAAMSLVKNETSPMCINYGNQQVLNTSAAVSQDPVIASAVRNEQFFKTAFRLESGEVSEPVMLDGQAVVLTLKEESAADSEMVEIYRQAFGPFTSEWTLNALADNYLSSAKHKDNFDATFLRYFISR